MQTYAVLAAVLRAKTVRLRLDRTDARAGLYTALKGCTRKVDAMALLGDLDKATVETCRLY